MRNKYYATILISIIFTTFSCASNDIEENIDEGFSTIRWLKEGPKNLMRLACKADYYFCSGCKKCNSNIHILQK